MDDSDRQRRRIAFQVRQLAARCACGRLGSMPPLYGGDRAPLIMSLPDDTVGSLLRSVVKAGGTAYLMVVDELAGDEVRLRVLRIERRSTPITDVGDRAGGPVTEDSSLGTLMREMTVGEQCSFYTYESETVIRFLADGIQPAPPGRPGSPAVVSEARQR